MAQPKLDKATAGYVSPPHNGAIYVQGDDYFAGNGDFLFSQKPGGAIVYPKAAKAAPATAPATTPSAPDPDAGDLGEPSEVEEVVDVIAWAKGEQKAEWFKIKKAAKELNPQIDISNAAMLKASLVKLGLVDKADVK